MAQFCEGVELGGGRDDEISHGGRDDSEDRSAGTGVAVDDVSDKGINGGMVTSISTEVTGGGRDMIGDGLSRRGSLY